MELVIFHDKVSPRRLDFLAGYSLVGLYVSVVMVAAKFIHEHFPGIARSIMYDQLPDVVHVLGLCAAVFPVRELGKLQLEQKLLARLSFLYRSPETTIKWTQRRLPAPATLLPGLQRGHGKQPSRPQALWPREAGSLPQPWVPRCQALAAAPQLSPRA